MHQNILADAVGRLVDLDQDLCQDPDPVPEGQEYEDHIFEQSSHVSAIQKVP